MTTRIIVQLTIATMLAGSALAAVSTASTPVVSAPTAKSDVTASSGALFVHLHRVADRFTTDCAGLKMAPLPIVCLTP